MIDRPKSVLVAMRKTQSYRETKMRLLQKLTGIDFLKASFDEGIKRERDWFTGFHRYQEKGEIIDSFVEGVPISCFSGKEDGLFYVAFYSGSTETINYLTVEARPSHFFIKECGAHFCAFRFQKEPSTQNVLVRTIKKSALEDMVENYALMLPYKKQNVAFQNQFTLVYHDWDVLLCQEGCCKKGLPTVDHCVFDEKCRHYLFM